MSRIGLKPIPLPDGVSIRQEDDTLHISGPKGELSSPVPPGVSLVQEDGVVRFERANDQKQTRAYHGLARALAANAVEGVHQGFQRNLLIEGIGYRAKMEGASLVLQLGFSHPVDFPVPSGPWRRRKGELLPRTCAGSITIRGVGASGLRSATALSIAMRAA